MFGGLFLDEVLAPQDFAGLALIALGLAAIDGRLLRILKRGPPRQPRGFLAGPIEIADVAPDLLPSAPNRMVVGITSTPSAPDKAILSSW